MMTKKALVVRNQEERRAGVLNVDQELSVRYGGVVEVHVLSYAFTVGNGSPIVAPLGVNFKVPNGECSAFVGTSAVSRIHAMAPDAVLVGEPSAALDVQLTESYYSRSCALFETFAGFLPRESTVGSIVDESRQRYSGNRCRR